MKLKILCIDDSKSVHAFLKDCLSGVALEVKSAFNGAEGLQTVNSNPEWFDCIFLDWEMPIKTGPEVLKELRDQNFSKPIYMLTSKNQLSDITQMIQLGATEYIMKPFTKDIILEKLAMKFSIDDNAKKV